MIYNIDEEFPSSVYTSAIPNLFSHNTQITFSSSKPIHSAHVSIYNAKGQLITTLEPQEGEASMKGMLSGMVKT